MNSRERGLALYRQGNFITALENFLADNTDPKEDSELAYYMALCYIRLNDSDQAIRLLKNALKGGGKLARIYQSHMLLAWLFVRKNATQEAEQQLRTLLKEGFQSPQSWAALGYCQWRHGKNDLAIESYQKAIELDKNNANATNNLGYLLAESGKNSKKAVALCLLASKAAPENMAYIDSLGWALFHDGRPREALEQLTKALANRPQDKTIKNHLEAIRTHVPSQN